ncbi:MAG: amidohydrolase [Clostridia bacterium]|jgi:predicted TIM-barrel fold metal-dependent hydrolase|nr:amidohydrolase [Clostridia bacterium]
MKIIDAHAHVAQYIAGFTSKGELRAVGQGKAQYSTGEIFQMFPPEMGDIGVSPEALLKVMDENDVEKAVLLQGNWLGFHNQYTYEAVIKYPERFVGAATYDPFCVNVEAVKKRLFDDLGFKIVKFELSTGSGLMANRPPVYLDGTVMNGCYAHAREKGLTVVMDIGRPNCPCWQVDALASAISKYPEVTFVICHLLAPQRGDVQILSDALQKLKMPNVYFDLASLANNQKPESFPYPTASKHLETAKNTVGADRLMFGSDMPSALARDSYTHLKDYIIQSGVFNEKELQDVFYNTAYKVFFRN